MFLLLKIRTNLFKSPSLQQNYLFLYLVEPVCFLIAFFCFGIGFIPMAHIRHNSENRRRAASTLLFIYFIKRTRKPQCLFDITKVNTNEIRAEMDTVLMMAESVKSTRE